MKAYLIDTFLRTRHGLPEELCLTPYLKAPGTWHAQGWKIFESDEVILFYTLNRDPVILIIKRLAGGVSRPWILGSFEQAASIAASFLTETDMIRFRFGIRPFEHMF